MHGGGAERAAWLSQLSPNPKQILGSKAMVSPGRKTFHQLSTSLAPVCLSISLPLELLSSGISILFIPDAEITQIKKKKLQICL